jgi:hypothetical protein
MVKLKIQITQLDRKIDLLHRQIEECIKLAKEHLKLKSRNVKN